MNLVYIACNTFIRGIKDWKYILIIIIAPIVTTILVGSISDSKDQLDDITKTRLVYCSEDRNFIGKSFEQLAGSEQIGRSFDIKRVSNQEEGNKLIETRSADAFIYISRDASNAIAKGENAEILVSSPGYSPAAILAQSFAHRINALAESEKIAAGQQPMPGNDKQTGKAVLAGTGQLTESIALSPASGIMSGVSKWSYLNLMLYIFYGCMVSSMSLISLVKMNIGRRVDSAPVGRFTKTAGILLGNSMILLFAEILNLIITKFALGANWNGSIPILAAVFVFYAILCSSIGTLLALVFKNTGICVLIVICANILLGNTMVMTVTGADNNVLKSFNRVSPHYQSYMAITNSIYQGNREFISRPVITLATMALVLMLLTVYAGRRRKA